MSPGMQMQQNQQSRQDFNRMTNQRTQEFQQRQLDRGMSRLNNPQLTQKVRLENQAKQQKMEQALNEKLADLAQEQQRQRQEHPAKNQQLAAAQQKADDKQLTRLAVESYHEVFLPGQVSKALEAQQLTPSAQQSLQHLNKNLLDDAWWSKQDGAQVAGKVKAYSDSLTTLTAGLLGFSLSSPPAKPAPFSISSLDEKLAKDAFDQNAANQLIQDAALTERLVAGDQLAKAVTNFTAAATSALPNDPKNLRKEVQKSLRTVNKELERYNARIAASDKIYSAENALRKSTSAYLAKKSK